MHSLKYKTEYRYKCMFTTFKDITKRDLSARKSNSSIKQLLTDANAGIQPQQPLINDIIDNILLQI